MMKIRFLTLAALALLLGACTQDELADGSRLSKEEYPISHPCHRTVRGGNAINPCIRERRLGGRQFRGTQDWRSGKGIHRYDYGCRRIQERHALTRERPVLLDQPQPDYRIGMVAHG